MPRRKMHQSSAIRHHDAGTTIIQHVADADIRKFRIDRNHGGACLHDSQHERDMRYALGKYERHDLSGHQIIGSNEMGGPS